MDLPGLTITIGCPGSGKSTWAENNLPPEALRLERDAFREALFGSRRAYHESPISYEDRSKVLRCSMLTAMRMWPTHQWVLSDTGLVYDAVHPFILEAIDLGERRTRLVIFERSRKYLETANRIRPHAHRVPPEVLDDCITKFEDPDAWWRKPAFDNMPTIYV